MKKNIALIGIVLGSLFWTQCSPPDDDYINWNTIELKVKNALKIENKENYTVGDTLFFELNFSRYLPEDGQTTDLDVYETSGVNKFTYGFGMLKYSSFSDSYQGVSINEKYLLSEKGSVNYASQVFTILNPDTNIYESRIGIILVEEGEYQLDFSYLTLYSDYNPDKPSVGIEHIISEDLPLLLNFRVSK
ncbi:hypothetical protein CLV91_1130 [Maribacter vaceletii]|uniref:Uncharacterized protein n=1 Tax=Maribacter vaceletii TaxID=1206816 RepID=A0A495EDT1_9FLAO|nr:hypothetical protein [Maribacter vaceletii]RKR15048.1 hypothetical protein CLV91_1130 [Maribacter vaceletii]